MTGAASRQAACACRGTALSSTCVCSPTCTSIIANRATTTPPGVAPRVTCTGGTNNMTSKSAYENSSAEPQDVYWGLGPASLGRKAANAARVSALCQDSRNITKEDGEQEEEKEEGLERRGRKNDCPNFRPTSEISRP
ncbi:unnamed protein product [Prorocentrum cordatum]|uniref:Uncharacterized protein n=1 Tax=Prorocentrum cordatum TaxID=2364126 RepID=A0ABN9XP56_9DINO|nr:unnamed protein product [Polarella glacialis]